MYKNELHPIQYRRSRYVKLAKRLSKIERCAGFMCLFFFFCCFCFIFHFRALLLSTLHVARLYKKLRFPCLSLSACLFQLFASSSSSPLSRSLTRATSLHSLARECANTCSLSIRNVRIEESGGKAHAHTHRHMHTAHNYSVLWGSRGSETQQETAGT